MNTAIKVRVTKNYGVEAIYPAANDEAAQLFANLIGKKTFNRTDLHTIRELGYEISIEAPVL